MPSIPQAHSNRYFYHFTHLENLDSIVQNGLLCTNEKNKKEIGHVDIACEGIQERRHTMSVTCGPKGFVHDYVPFYFCTTNPMFLSMLYTKNVDQQFIVIFAIPIKKILEEGVVFTSASANTKIPPTFYYDPADLDELDWEAIDNRKWSSSSDDERHCRMAEVLIHKKVPATEIDTIIVWNDSIKEQIIKIYEENKVKVPKLSYSKFNGRHFFFTKFGIEGRDNESLVTGPLFLKKIYKKAVNTIIAERQSADPKMEYPFNNIAHCLKTLKTDFSAIPELAGIYQLETLNEVHAENVSDHTLKVVANVRKSSYFKDADTEDQNILLLAAYLHDIGKGPHSKWPGGKQKSYPDHPAEAPKMLMRILVEDIKDLSEDEIRMLCLLTTYHDLIGEIFFKERNEQQLIDILEDKRDFEMLHTLNYADVSAIRFDWAANYMVKINTFRKRILSKLDS